MLFTEGNISNHMGSFHGVVAKVLDWNIIISKFEFQFHFYIYFQIWESIGIEYEVW